MHPNTNSSNWQVECFPRYLHISDGCKSREKLCLDFAPSAIACQRVWCQGREHKQCWDGGELWYSSALCCAPDAAPMRRGCAQPSSLSRCVFLLHLQLGLWNLYRANTKLTFVSCWNAFEEEKTPACLPGCLFPTLYSKPLYCCATKVESERAGNKNLLDGKSE